MAAVHHHIHSSNGLCCSSLIHNSSDHIESLKRSTNSPLLLATSSPLIRLSPNLTNLRKELLNQSTEIINHKLVDIKSSWTKNHQEQVFKWVDKLDKAQLSNLLDILAEIDVVDVNTIYQTTAAQEEAEKTAQHDVKPFVNVTRFADATAEQRTKWEQAGLDLISKGKVGVLLLAGGQASRLGCLCPKGTYDIGLPSKKSLYQMQVERAIKLQRIAAQRNGKSTCDITWYIMTSPATYVDTVAFFHQNEFFGEPEKNFFFFNQATLPCLTPEGKFIMESAGKIALAPNGNGGLYKALHDSGALKDMANKGIQYIAQYCVDNALIRVADPMFIGFMQASEADCAAKVVSKAYPEEPVGVMCLMDGKPSVIEYSEITPELRNLRDENNELVYNYSHICINNFTVEFLQRIADQHLDALRYHVARKKIPHANEKGETQPSKVENGWKLERFIFDAFQFSKKMVALEVLREDEFSPLKNAANMPVPKDSPETCLADISRLCTKFIVQAGGTVQPDSNGAAVVEISPLVSYAGEDLEDKVKGQTLQAPVLFK